MIVTICRIGFVLCLIACLAFKIKPGSTLNRSAPFFSSHQSPEFKQEIDKILIATNQERAAKRLTPVQPDAKLMTAAQQYAEQMAAEDELSHTIGGVQLPDKARKVGYSFRRLSENIAYNTVLNGRFVVVEQWMKSKGHRQNLLTSDISQIGIGISGPSKRTKRYYYCQIFGLPLL